MSSDTGLQVDGRGTGFRGRDYRVGVRGRLGELEVIDQVNAGRHWQELDYVDSSRMAIWGWVSKTFAVPLGRGSLNLLVI